MYYFNFRLIFHIKTILPYTFGKLTNFYLMSLLQIHQLTHITALHTTLYPYPERCDMLSLIEFLMQKNWGLIMVARNMSHRTKKKKLNLKSFLIEKRLETASEKHNALSKKPQIRRAVSTYVVWKSIRTSFFLFFFIRGDYIHRPYIFFLISLIGMTRTCSSWDCF